MTMLTISPGSTVMLAIGGSAVVAYVGQPSGWSWAPARTRPLAFATRANWIGVGTLVAG